MESAAHSVVSNVVKLLGEEYQLLSGVGGEVAELRDDLDTMNALHRMQSEAEDGAVDHFVAVWMKQLRELAYDSEDCIDLYKLRIKSRPNVGVRAWLGRLLGTLSPRRRLACDIRALRARATAISERHARYGVNRDALRRSPFLLPDLAAVASASSSSPGSAPAKNADRHRFVGIEDQANTLAELLKKTRGGETGTGEPKAVFSVVGFGGLGKTTLAMEVCRIVEPDFPFQAMVAVSQVFEATRDLKPLLKRVLQQVLKCRRDNENEHRGLDGDFDRLDASQLATKLEQGLMGKRYLIVIDDVWTVRAWEAIQSVLPENKCGSRVVVTTRIESVAKACSPSSASEEYIYHIQRLSQEDSRKLFLSRAFGSRDAQCLSSLEVAILDSILRKCGGMPLAIVSIASVLAGYMSSGNKEKWEVVCKSMGSQMEMNPTLEGMSRILTLSYNHLPHELKSCMMYLSIFPEDYAIRKDRLLHRWIAEGLIPEKRGLAMLEVAESYFDELLSRNMIFSVQGPRWDYGISPFDYDGKKECYQVHDMMLEVMVSKSLEYNFVSLQGGQYSGMSYDRIRRLSFHEGVGSGTNIHISGGQDRDSARKKSTSAGRGRNEETNGLQHVRSLSMFQLHGNKLLLDQLGNFTLLRVLDLEDCRGIENKHVRYACQLHLLKFLSFKRTDITEIPRQINNLEHLQTLDLRATVLNKDLPATVTELEKLERLHINSYGDIRMGFLGNMVRYWRLPAEGLSSMKELREVGVVLLDNVKAAQELGKLEQLQELAVRVDNRKIQDDDKKAFAQEVANSLSKLYSLRSLDISAFLILSRDSNALKCLRRLQDPPRLLRHLCVRGAIDCHQLPTWVGSLTYLVEILLKEVRNLRDDEPFGVLSKLPSLQSIKMEGQCYSGEELVARTSHNFPTLVNLTIEHWIGRPQVYRFEVGSMPKLEKLAFLDFGNQTGVVTGIEHMTKLKEVKLWGAKTNNAFNRAVEQFKAESGRREAGCTQFQVIVT